MEMTSSSFGADGPQFFKVCIVDSTLLRDRHSLHSFKTVECPPLKFKRWKFGNLKVWLVGRLEVWKVGSLEVWKISIRIDFKKNRRLVSGFVLTLVPGMVSRLDSGLISGSSPDRFPQ